MRAAAVLEALQSLVPLDMTVLAACERRIWPPALEGATTCWLAEPCDVGVVQSDDVTVDLSASARAIGRWLTQLPALLEREASRLRGAFDLVVGDVPSPAFEAAKRAGIPSVAIANFSWDWIYGELGFGAAAEAAAAGYARAGLLLETTPSGPMPAFPRTSCVGLVARRPSPRGPALRRELGVREGEKVALLAFQPASAPAVALPRPRDGRLYLVPHGWPAVESRPDLRRLPDGASFLDALAAADVVLGKPGYGLLGDVEAAGVPFLYVPRPGFPENAVLEDHLAVRSATTPLAVVRLASGDWEDVLAALESCPRPRPADAGGAMRAATAIAGLLGIDSSREPV